MKLVFIISLFLILSGSTIAGGIRGTILSDDRQPLPYASIFVKQAGSGAVTDLKGRYELQLPPGHYDLIFQYLGFQSVTKAVDISSGFIEINITMKTQVVVLQAVTVRANKEDPAYTIMRKAIGKANYHTQQLDSYSAKVYIKGKGKLIDYPWFAKKKLEQEGITKDRLFIIESVSEIKFTRPNKFEEKVIAVYTQGGNTRDVSPNAYIFGSFYEPEIAETVSPLSPKSFSYYRFEYLGSFKDRNYEISKIKVTPRSRGDNVFEGTLFIVEDWWSIHSLDFTATKLGINFHVKQIYNPIEDKAWLPVSQQADVSGKVMGFEFAGTYLATVKDYQIKLNPALPLEMKVIDEKIEKQEAKKVSDRFSKKGQQLKERLEGGKEISNKELKKMVKEYEKAEQKKEKEPEVISNRSFTIDTAAYKRDSSFWMEMRPMPLDKEEVKGYKKADSIHVVQRKRDEGDSMKPSRNKGFQIYDIFTGDRYKIGKHVDFEIRTPWGGFNTVEGFNVIYGFNFTRRWVKRDTLNPDAPSSNKRFTISPIFRYSFARNLMTGYLRFDYRTRRMRFILDGGKYIQQYNSEQPILPIVNTLTSLFMGQNYMKIYEREYVDLKYRQKLDEKYSIHSEWTWARRTELFNNTNYTFFNRGKETYTPNAPVNVELQKQDFSPHYAFTGSFGVEARPWQKYRIRNGYKSRVANSSPLITLDYRKGFNGILGSEIDYDLLELGFRHWIKLGIRGNLDINLKGGKFLNSSKMFFMDFKHFAGNQTPLITADPAGSYRLLDYYKYSTRDQYLSSIVHYHFRKFLISRIPKFRMLGFTENVFVNYLATPSSHNYMEVGYGIDGFLRLFRLEFATGFQDGKNTDLGFRIGISSTLSINFSD